MGSKGGRLMDKIRFNINNYVWVKLTSEGRKIKKKIEDDFRSEFPSYLGIPMIENSDGWSRWQLWELMEMFGSSLCNGCSVPFETEILIEHEGNCKCGGKGFIFDGACGMKDCDCVL